MSFQPTPIGQVVGHVATWSPERDDPDGTFVYVDLSSVDQDQKAITEERTLACVDAPSRARQLIRHRDVLVSTVRPNLNGVARVPNEFDGATASTGFCVLRPKANELDSDYLFHWVKSPGFIREMVRRATGASYPAVSDRIIAESRIPLPPLPEQRRIADILDKADELRAKRRAAIAKLDTLTQSIFLDMFGDPATNPKGWPLVPIRDCTQRIQIGPFGSLLHQEDYVSGGIPLVNPKHIVNGTIVPGDEETVSPEKYSKLGAYHLQTGDVVMGRRGEMGRCAVVDVSTGPLLCGTGSLYLRPHEQRTTSLFLYSVLSSAALKDRLERLSLGQTLPNLNTGIVEKLLIPLAPVAVQKLFVERVGAVRRLREPQQSSSQSLEFLFSAVQHRAFAGEL